jgi:hypothetical protein
MSEQKTSLSPRSEIISAITQEMRDRQLHNSFKSDTLIDWADRLDAANVPRRTNEDTTQNAKPRSTEDLIEDVMILATAYASHAANDGQESKKFDRRGVVQSEISKETQSKLREAVTRLAAVASAGTGK